MKVAIIPARGGSKRIPRKNIKNFCGKPMIAYSIHAARESGLFDKIIVSTDDNEIAKIAIQFGADVPFTRPESISGDYAGTIPVIKHAVEWITENISKPDYICCIYATAPFINKDDILKGLAEISAGDCEYAFSITSYPYPIQRALMVSESRQIEMFNPELFNTRSQDLIEAWHDAGQFYWGTYDAWVAESPIFTARSRGIILPRHRVQDIDTQEDWVLAELMMKASGLAQ
ncbi:pseudaminic acid cytidylyltransferase [Rahnella victoriana]|uniref:pseudaminic acid cytidylyltransferase n=1 Tax=Rahnella victoriana TaxID=1510570 RepID=UPI000E6BC9CA|nr:pseudaminic acid cytidylyltransferase [Rahnella victoriana]UHM89919.1 pseudaminic acid cytidylyltransferase [Rahnella victoriana]